MPDSEACTWATLCHASFFVAVIFGPMIILLTKGKANDFIRENALEALNFQLTVGLALLVSGVLIIVLIGLLLVAVVYVVGAVLSVIAARAAHRGEAYRYPVALRIMA